MNKGKSKLFCNFDLVSSTQFYLLAAESAAVLLMVSIVYSGPNGSFTLLRLLSLRRVVVLACSYFILYVHSIAIWSYCDIQSLTREFKLIILGVLPSLCLWPSPSNCIKFYRKHLLSILSY